MTPANNLTNLGCVDFGQGISFFNSLFWKDFEFIDMCVIFTDSVLEILIGTKMIMTSLHPTDQFNILHLVQIILILVML